MWLYDNCSEQINSEHKRFRMGSVAVCLAIALSGQVSAQQLSNIEAEGIALQYEDARSVARKVNDVKSALINYYVANNEWPATLNTLISDGYYGGNFATGYNSDIAGTISGNFYELSYTATKEVLAEYTASLLEGTNDGNDVTIIVETPAQAAIVSQTLSRIYDVAGSGAQNTMETNLLMGGNDISGVGSITAGSVLATVGVFDNSERVFSPVNLPTKNDVGLGLVENYSASSDYTTDSTTTYLTTAGGAAVYNDLDALKLDVTAKATDSELLDGIDSAQFVQISRTINGYRLSDDIVLNSADTGSVPLSRTVNGHALSDDISLDKTDIGLSLVQNYTISDSYTGGQSTVYASQAAVTNLYNEIQSNYLRNDSDQTITGVLTADGFSTTGVIQGASAILSGASPTLRFSDTVGSDFVVYNDDGTFKIRNDSFGSDVVTVVNNDVTFADQIISQGADINGQVDISSTANDALLVSSGTGNRVATFSSTDDTATIRLQDDGSYADISTQGGNVIVDVDPLGAESNSDFIVNVDGTRVLEADVNSVDVTSTFNVNNGNINLSPSGSHNGIINAPASVFINIDSDNNNSGRVFVVGNNSDDSSSTRLLEVQEDGDVIAQNGSIGVGGNPTFSNFNKGLDITDPSSAGIRLEDSGASKSTEIYQDGSVLNIRAINPNMQMSVSSSSGVSQFAVDMDDGRVTLGAENVSNGIINAPESVFINIDSNNDDTTEYFAVTNNTAGTGGTHLLEVNEAGQAYIHSGLGISTTVSSNARLEIDNAASMNELYFSGTDFTNILSQSTSGFQLGTVSGGGGDVNFIVDGNSKLYLAESLVSASVPLRVNSGETRALQVNYNGGTSGGFVYQSFMEGGTEDWWISGDGTSRHLAIQVGNGAMAMQFNRDATIDMYSRPIFRNGTYSAPGGNGLGSVYTSSSYGPVFYGQGTSYDLSLANRSGSTAMSVLANSQDVRFFGDYIFYGSNGSVADFDGTKGISIAPSNGTPGLLMKHPDTGRPWLTYASNNGDYRIYDSAENIIRFRIGSDGIIHGNGGGLTNVDANSVAGIAGSNIATLSGVQTFTSSKTFVDNAQVTLGSGNDFVLYHDGTNSYIRNFSNDLYIRNDAAGGDAYLSATGAGGAQYTGISVVSDGANNVLSRLHYNGAARLQTTNDGVTILGTINTGQGSTEIYLQDQDLRRQDAVTFASISGDGSGVSNVNAISLNGFSHTAFMRSGVDYTYNNAIGTFQNDSSVEIESGVSGTHALQVRSGNSTGDAFMTFHIGGDYAFHFGLDGEYNDLVVGGYSMGSNKYRIWGEHNDGAGSGLNADKLDDLESAQFVRSDANDVITGHTEWQDNNQVRLGSGADLRMYHSGTHTYFANYTGNVYNQNYAAGGDWFVEVENNSGTRHTAIAAIGDGDVYGALYANGTIRGYADTSGFRVSGRIRADSGTHVFEAGADGNIELTRSSGSAYIDFKNGNGEDYDVRLHQVGANAQLNVIGATDGLLINSNKVWHAGNDGDGSGLDADRLAGVDHSNYSRLDIQQTRTASLRMTDNVALSSGTSDDFQFYHNGSDSFILNRTNDIYIRNEATGREIYLEAANNSGVNRTALAVYGDTSVYPVLMHNGVEVLRTISSGTQMLDLQMTNSGDSTVFTPYDDGAWQTSRQFLYDSSQNRWEVETALDVGGTVSAGGFSTSGSVVAGAVTADVITLDGQDVAAQLASAGGGSSPFNGLPNGVYSTRSMSVNNSSPSLSATGPGVLVQLWVIKSDLATDWTCRFSVDGVSIDYVNQFSTTRRYVVFEPFGSTSSNINFNTVESFGYDTSFSFTCTRTRGSGTMHVGATVID